MVDYRMPGHIYVHTLLISMYVIIHTHYVGCFTHFDIRIKGGWSLWSHASAALLIACGC